MVYDYWFQLSYKVKAVSDYTESYFCSMQVFFLFSLNLFICFMVHCVDYFRVVSRSLKELHLKENKMIEELQRDVEQECKLKEEIEVCFSD